MDDDEIARLVKAAGVELLERGELTQQDLAGFHPTDLAAIKRIQAYLLRTLPPEVIAGCLAGALLGQGGNEADAMDLTRKLVKLEQTMLRRLKGR